MSNYPQKLGAFPFVLVGEDNLPDYELPAEYLAVVRKAIIASKKGLDTLQYGGTTYEIVPSLQTNTSERRAVKIPTINNDIYVLFPEGWTHCDPDAIEKYDCIMFEQNLRCYWRDKSGAGMLGSNFQLNGILGKIAKKDNTERAYIIFYNTKDSGVLETCVNLINKGICTPSQLVDNKIVEKDFLIKAQKDGFIHNLQLN